MDNEPQQQPNGAPLGDTTEQTGKVTPDVQPAVSTSPGTSPTPVVQTSETGSVASSGDSPSTPPSVTPKKSSLMKILAIVLVVLLVASGAFLAWKHFEKKPAPVQASSAKTIRIGLSMDTLKELRWPKDLALMQERAKQLGASLTVLVANGDDATQVSQIENLISQKVDVLVIIPHASEPVAPTIEEAHKAGIKVLSYDRLILGSDVDTYLSFNNEVVGKNSAQYVVNALPAGKVANVAIVGGAPTDNNATLIHAGIMGVLSPLVTANKLKVVYDKPTDDWNPDLAYTNFKAFLATGAAVDGVVGANDGTAGGAIKALTEKGLAGKIPVTGQDADLPAIQRLVAGTQTMTNYKPIKPLAYKAIELAIDMAKGKKIVTNATINNQKKDVLSFLLEPVPVTKDNIKTTVIKDGFYTTQDVYGSAAQ